MSVEGSRHSCFLDQRCDWRRATFLQPPCGYFRHRCLRVLHLFLPVRVLQSYSKHPQWWHFDRLYPFGKQEIEQFHLAELANSGLHSGWEHLILL